MTDSTAQTDQCRNCRALVATDQAYCLRCGARQAGARLPFELPGRAGRPTPAGVPSAAAGLPPNDWTPVLALGGLAALVLALVIGVLIGRSGQSSTSKLAAAPQVITVQGAGSAASAPASTGAATSVAAISEDWAAGKSAWTIELQRIPKAGASAASVNAAKSAATGKGAPAVGVLDAGSHKSLGSGYVIYSGVYGTKAQATAALSKLSKSFPSAKVIHVVPSGGSGSGGAAASAGAPASASQQAAGAAAIQSLSNCSGAACSKAARKITQPIATPGKPPPKDNKPAGGGSAGQSFQ